MILREDRQAVITFIDYSVAFDTESQMFLDEALAEAGVGGKVCRIVQAILSAATGVVRLRHPYARCHSPSHSTSPDEY